MEENKKEIVGLLNLIHDEKYIDFIRCLLKDYVKSSPRPSKSCKFQPK